MQQLVRVVVLLIAGCGGGDKAKLEAIKDAMCACKDKTCADRVMATNEAWIKTFLAKFPQQEHGRDVPADLMAIISASDACLREATRKESMEEYEHIVHPTDPPPSEVATKLLAAMTAAKDPMCACKDKACADKVDADLDAKVKALRAASPDLNPSAAQSDQLEEAGKAVAECRDRASK